MSDLATVLNEIKSMSHLMTPDEMGQLGEILNSLMPPIDVWMEENFYIPETGKPITLYPHQKDALNEATRKNEEGKYAYSTVVWSDIKKSAKTTIGGARVLHMVLTKPYATARVVGNDLDQAKSRMFQCIKICLDLHPTMAEEYDIRYSQQSREIYIGALGSKITAIPVDPSGEAGGGDDLIAFTELWGFQNKAHIDAWAELTLSPLKAGESQRWAESYAGFTGKSVVLENLYEQTVEHGHMVPNREGYEWYTDTSKTVFTMWNTEPRLPWQTPEYYQAEKIAIPDDESFMRMHRNQWASPTSRFIQSDHYLEKCAVESIKMPLFNAILYGASDAGVLRDSCATIFVMYNKNTDIVTVALESEFIPIEGVSEVDLSDSEDVIVTTNNKHRVVVWGYDPHQLEYIAQRVSNSKVTKKVVQTFRFTQVSKRVEADTSLLERIKSGRLQYVKGSRLETHLKNADAQILAGDKLRLVKRNDRLKIDLAVCLSMCCYLAEHADDLKLIVPDSTQAATDAPMSEYMGAPVQRGSIGESLPSEIGTSLPKEMGL